MARKFANGNGSPIISSQGVALTETQLPADREYAPGDRIEHVDGREFTFAEATGAIAAGNPVQITDNIGGGLVAGTTTTGSAIGESALIDSAAFAAITADSLGFAYVQILTGTGIGQKRWIKTRVSDDELEVSEPWTTAIAIGDTFTIFRPFAVAAKAATAISTPGVAQVAIASGSFGWIQTAGLGSALCDTSQDPILPGQIVTVGTAVAGTVEGRTGAGTTVADIEGKVGDGVVDITADGLVILNINPSGSF